jgi:hypothetical protein
VSHQELERKKGKGLDTLARKGLEKIDNRAVSSVRLMWQIVFGVVYFVGLFLQVSIKHLSLPVKKTVLQTEQVSY